MLVLKLTLKHPVVREIIPSTKKGGKYFPSPRREELYPSTKKGGGEKVFPITKKGGIISKHQEGRRG